MFSSLQIHGTRALRPEGSGLVHLDLRQINEDGAENVTSLGSYFTNIYATARKSWTVLRLLTLKNVLAFFASLGKNSFMKLILGGGQHGCKMLEVQKTDQELQRNHGTSLQMVPPHGNKGADITLLGS